MGIGSVTIDTFYGVLQGWINYLPCVANPFDPNDSYIDEAIGYTLGAIGFYFQITNGFALQFPLNLILLPLSIVEWLLRFQVKRAWGGWVAGEGCEACPRRTARAGETGRGGLDDKGCVHIRFAAAGVDGFRWYRRQGCVVRGSLCSAAGGWRRLPRVSGASHTPWLRATRRLQTSRRGKVGSDACLTRSTSCDSGESTVKSTKRGCVPRPHCHQGTQSFAPLC